MAIIAALGFAFSFVDATNVAAAEQASFEVAGLGFVKKHCVKCHQGEKPQAELSLDVFKDETSALRERRIWTTMLSRVQTGDMPPEDQPRPSEAEIEAFVTAVNESFDRADRNAKPDPGRVTMRRLNRTEYRNTIRDLVGVDFDPTGDFPSDDIGHGFDNIGDVLSLSPVLMERYLAAAESIMALAITPIPPKPVNRHVAGRFTEPASGNVPAKGQYRYISTLPSDSPVKTGPIHTPYQVEEDGEYVFRTKVYAYREKTLDAIGKEKKEPATVAAADDLLADIEKEEGVKAEGNKEEPAFDRPIMAVILAVGADVPNLASDEEAAEVFGIAAQHLRPYAILKKFEVTAREAKQAQSIEIKLPPTPGIKRFAVALLKDPAGTPPANLFVEYLSLEGPLDTRPRAQRVLLDGLDTTDKPALTRAALAKFIRRAYRRPGEPEEIERLAGLVEAVMSEGGNWEAGMQLAMQAVLISPKFLFRVEMDEKPSDPTIRPINEFHLASRLSYFLWSTMPDEELLKLAEQGKLKANLTAQVQRMLQDPKSDALLQNFSMQWLQLKRLDSYAPDAKLFPNFDESLRRAMLQETKLFFQSVAREDRSILELLQADYAFMNERLANHYGIADTQGTHVGDEPTRKGGQRIKGDEFVRVSLADGERGGLLTQASILTVTSNPTRTSPVKRGRWVLEQILGTPPPPPPPNVPELMEAEQAALSGSLRQRMEQHRSNPACASCHARMDPLGFAFENYDAIGAFRKKDGVFDIDPAGELPGGQTFSGPDELKKILAEKRDLFARCLAEKMLTYAIGRGVEYYDRPVVDKIVKRLGEQDYKFSALISEIVLSEAFQKRRGIPASTDGKP